MDIFLSLIMLEVDHQKWDMKTESSNSSQSGSVVATHEVSARLHDFITYNACNPIVA
jgi:hypothetical protein